MSTGGTATIEGVEVSTEHWIGGNRVASADTFTDVSPIDEQPIAEVARGGTHEAAAAVAAARGAFAVWGGMAPMDRAAVLHAIADGVEARVPDLAAVETRDNGSLLRSMRNSVMPRVARNFRFFADRLLELEEPDVDFNGFAEHVSWDPSGVAVVITPWNAPLMLATWRIAPALAAGNTVVVKPPEWAPLTASMLADIAHEAGLARRRVQRGPGDRRGGRRRARRRTPTSTGSRSRAPCRPASWSPRRPAPNLTPVSLELGGKSPFVAFADADMDALVKQAVGQFDNAGQVCLAGTRLLVQREIYDEFLDRFVEAAAAIRQGDPRDDATDIGPQITREHFDRVDGFVRRAIADGAKPVLGGGAERRPRRSLLPAHGCSSTRRPAPRSSREEVFGPVLTVQPFARRGRGGRARQRHRLRPGGDPVHGRSRLARERVSARLVAGTVWVNCFFVRDLNAPFGGSRNSGIGREGGIWSFDFYADVKNVCTAPWNEGS